MDNTTNGAADTVSTESQVDATDVSTPTTSEPISEPVSIFRGDAEDVSATMDIEGVDNDDAEAIRKVTAGEFEKTSAENANLRAKIDVGEFLSEGGNEFYKEFKDQAIKILSDPSNRLDTDAAFYAIAGKSGKLESIIAKKLRQADLQAKDSATSDLTGGVQDQPSSVDTSNMSTEEWNKHRAEQLSKLSR